MLAGHFDTREVASFVDGLWEKWGREVAVFRQPFTNLLATKAEYWKVIQGWADEVRAGKHNILPKWVDRGMLPTERDVDIETFCERVESQGEDWYLYVTDGAQRLAPVLWHRMIEILRPIIERTGGLPPGGFMFDLFLGRYDRTPAGIHRDEADTLAFVTHGTKRLHFWPRETFQDLWGNQAKTHYQTGIWDYEKYLDQAITVEAKAGDIIYWPRRYYHIGESRDHWSGMFTLGMWWFASPERAVRFIAQALTGGDSDPIAYPLDLRAFSSAARAMPPALAAASQAMQTRLQRGWKRVETEAWARIVTAYGFTVPPSRMSPHAGPRYMVRHPIAVIELDGRQAVFACGHHAGFSDGAALSERLDALQPGDLVDVRELAAGGAGDSKAAELASTLCAVGALVPLE